jgi:circadian clock protein KaiC
VLKKRTGRHERTIHQLRFDGGLVVGDPIREWHGVLAGTPEAVSRS